MWYTSSMEKKRYIMQRKEDGLFFITRRPNTGLGDLMTSDPNEAAIYNYATPMGFQIAHDLWEAVEVEVHITVVTE